MDVAMAHRAPEYERFGVDVGRYGVYSTPPSLLRRTPHSRAVDGDSLFHIFSAIEISHSFLQSLQFGLHFSVFNSIPLNSNGREPAGKRNAENRERIIRFKIEISRT